MRRSFDDGKTGLFGCARTGNLPTHIERLHARSLVSSMSRYWNHLPCVCSAPRIRFLPSSSTPGSCVNLQILTEVKDPGAEGREQTCPGSSEASGFGILLRSLPAPGRSTSWTRRQSPGSGIWKSHLAASRISRRQLITNTRSGGPGAGDRPRTELPVEEEILSVRGSDAVLRFIALSRANSLATSCRISTGWPTHRGDHVPRS